MLERIVVERFKSLSSVDLTLGRLNLFIGTNASGKSNLLDALRVLQGVGYNFTIREIFDGKPRSSSSVAWRGIRGGSKEAVLKGKSDHQSTTTCRFATRFSAYNDIYEFDVTLNPVKGRVVSEKLVVSERIVYETKTAPKRGEGISVQVFGEKQDDSVVREYFSNRPIYYQVFSAGNVPDSQWSMRAIDVLFSQLRNQQHLDLNPDQLRQYSSGPTAKRLGEHGEDFAALVNTIVDDSRVREEYMSWLRELVPSEINSIKLLPGAVGDVLFAIQENGSVFPATVVSDGTLRFAALAAALFQPDMPNLLLLEEIENGIHPTRLRLLIELLHSRTRADAPQILATTHSPILLAWLKPEDYEHTFFCARGDDGFSIIRPVTAIPQFQDIVRRTPFSDLFAEGWLESAL